MASGIYQQIIASETARQQQSGQDIQNMFAQFGQAVEQGRQKRQLEDLALTQAENKMGFLAQQGGFEPFMEQFSNAKNTQEALAIASSAESIFSMQQAQQERALQEENIRSQIQLREAQAKAEGLGKIQPVNLRETMVDGKKVISSFSRDAYGNVVSKVVADAPEDIADLVAHHQIKKMTREEQEAIKTQQRQNIQAKRKVSDNMRTFLALDDEIDKALSQANDFTTGFFSIAKHVPGTPQANLAARMETIAARAGFDELQAMRDASKTGGALGNVSEKELGRVEAAQASLLQSQTKEQFIENLKKFKQIRREAFINTAAAYYEDFGEMPRNVPEDLRAEIDALVSGEEVSPITEQQPTPQAGTQPAPTAQPTMTIGASNQVPAVQTLQATPENFAQVAQQNPNATIEVTMQDGSVRVFRKTGQ